MTLKRMDNVGVVVDDLAAAVAFFKETPAVLGNPTVISGVGVTHLRYAVRKA